MCRPAWAGEPIDQRDVFRVCSHRPRRSTSLDAPDIAGRPPPRRDCPDAPPGSSTERKLEKQDGDREYGQAHRQAQADQRDGIAPCGDLAVAEHEPGRLQYLLTLGALGTPSALSRAQPFAPSPPPATVSLLRVCGPSRLRRWITRVERGAHAMPVRRSRSSPCVRGAGGTSNRCPARGRRPPADGQG